MAVCPHTTTHTHSLTHTRHTLTAVVLSWLILISSKLGYFVPALGVLFHSRDTSCFPCKYLNQPCVRALTCMCVSLCSLAAILTEHKNHQTTQSNPVYLQRVQIPSYFFVASRRRRHRHSHTYFSHFSAGYFTWPVQMMHTLRVARLGFFGGRSCRLTYASG